MSEANASPGSDLKYKSAQADQIKRRTNPVCTWHAKHL